MNFLEERSCVADKASDAAGVNVRSLAGQRLLEKVLKRRNPIRSVPFRRPDSFPESTARASSLSRSHNEIPPRLALQRRVECRATSRQLRTTRGKRAASRVAGRAGTEVDPGSEQERIQGGRQNGSKTEQEERRSGSGSRSWSRSRSRVTAGAQVGAGSEQKQDPGSKRRRNRRGSRGQNKSRGGPRARADPEQEKLRDLVSGQEQEQAQGQSRGARNVLDSARSRPRQPWPESDQILAGAGAHGQTWQAITPCLWGACTKRPSVSFLGFAKENEANCEKDNSIVECKYGAASKSSPS